MYIETGIFLNASSNVSSNLEFRIVFMTILILINQSVDSKNCLDKTTYIFSDSVCDDVGKIESSYGEDEE